MTAALHQTAAEISSGAHLPLTSSDLLENPAQARQSLIHTGLPHAFFSLPATRSRPSFFFFFSGISQGASFAHRRHGKFSRRIFSLSPSFLLSSFLSIVCPFIFLLLPLLLFPHLALQRNSILHSTLRFAIPQSISPTTMSTYALSTSHKEVRSAERRRRKAPMGFVWPE